jgi:hypothetical protein
MSLSGLVLIWARRHLHLHSPHVPSPNARRTCGLEPGSSAGGPKWDHFTPSAASLYPNSAATLTPGGKGSGSGAGGNGSGPSRGGP